jgi:hypothetical protein
VQSESGFDAQFTRKSRCERNPGSAIKKKAASSATFHSEAGILAAQWAQAPLPAIEATIFLALFESLLSRSLGSIVLGALLGGENVSEISLLLLLKRLETWTEFSSLALKRCAGTGGVTLLTERSNVLELRLHLSAKRLELCAILLADRFHLRLLRVGEVEILYEPAAELAATAESAASSASTEVSL